VHRLRRRSNSESYRYLLQFRGRHTHRAFACRRMCLLDTDEGAVFSSLIESFPYRVWKVKPVGEI
jgi:hypothetical protein